MYNVKVMKSVYHKISALYALYLGVTCYNLPLKYWVEKTRFYLQKFKYERLVTGFICGQFLFRN